MCTSAYSYFIICAYAFDVSYGTVSQAHFTNDLLLMNIFNQFWKKKSSPISILVKSCYFYFWPKFIMTFSLIAIVLISYYFLELVLIERSGLASVSSILLTIYLYFYEEFRNSILERVVILFEFSLFIANIIVKLHIVIPRHLIKTENNILIVF